MKAKNLQLILQIGTVLSFISLFLVSSDLLFPYITSKQLVFNVLVEMMLPFYIILIWRYPQYRLKKKLVALALSAYFLVILLSSFFGVDFNLSFWGNAERMLGWFHLVHYLAFFFYLLAAWRSIRQWYYLLSFFVGLGVVISLFYLGGDNRIGNTAYLSGYLLFNLFLALVLFVKSKAYLRYVWLLSLLPILMALYQAKTSGAFFALAFSIFLLLFLLGVLMEKRIYRIWTWIVLIVFIASIFALFSQRDTDWFREHRLLSGLTFEKDTFQTRLVSWEGAMKEIPNNWLMGVGYGNYATIFDKQFDSRFFDYARNETYFDRAHNNIIDITATTGVFGLITYLSIFVALLYYLFLLLKKRGLKIKLEEKRANSSIEIIILVALLSAYFVQNLAVFDTQSTYFSLMIVLAYIVFLAQKELYVTQGETENHAYKPLKSSMKLALIVLTIFSIILISINYRTVGLFTGVVDAYAKITKDQVEVGLKDYKEAMEINTPLKRNARSILINYFNENPEILASLSTDMMQENIDYIISLAQENVNYNQRETKANSHLSQTLESSARLIKDKNESNKLLFESLQAIDKAIESSPERAPLYLSKAQTLLGLEDYDRVIENVEKAISLNENLPDGYCHLAQIYLALDREEMVFDNLDKCLKRDGADKISLDNLLIKGLEHYKEYEDYEKALQILERLEQLKPDDPAVYFELIMINIYLDNTNESIVAANKLVELEVGIEKASDLFIQIANEELTNDRIEYAIIAAEIAAELEPSLEAALDDFISELKKEGMIEDN